MADPLTQDERTGKLTTALADNTLVLASAHVAEAMSELFEIRIEAASLDANIDFNAALGKPVTVSFIAPGGAKRYYNGILTEAEWAGQRQTLYVYNLVVRPTFWLCTQSSNARIFEKMDAMEIVKQVLAESGLPIDINIKLSGKLPKIEYCVQYCETDFDFISRLLEEYGVYYFFRHDDGAHTIVFADSLTSHQEAGKKTASLPFNPVEGAGRREIEHVEAWSRGRSSQSGRFVLKDYDYNKPGANLLGEADKSGSYEHAKMEMFDFHGGYDNKGDGDTRAAIQAEAAQSLDDRRKATGVAPTLYPGALRKLEKHPVAGENIEYIVTRCAHFIDAQRYRSGGAGDEGRIYVGAYEFTPSSRQFRAPQETPKPEMSGVQSAIVVASQGKESEEIDVDEQGRILVRFYWDRKKKYSCRVRVAQIWAGFERGAKFIPRIGDEVLIQYQDGDPDRPIVVGSVYNGDNKIPSDMPSKKNISGVLTRSTKGGGGYNMLMFDDTKGQEVIKLRSQKDLMMKALHNETVNIGANSDKTVGANATETIGGDDTITVGSMTGGGNFTLNSTQTVTINVGPKEMPLTKIVMDNQSITLSVGPEGMASQIAMSMTGITMTAGPSGLAGSVAIGPMGVTMQQTPAASHSVSLAGITAMAPNWTLTAFGSATMLAPAVTIGAAVTMPLVTIGAGTVSGLPLV